MTSRERFTDNQIVLLRSLIQRGAAYRAVAIRSWQRITALPLWRRGLVEVWYRQSVDANPSLQGPYYALTIVGARIADSFLHPAPRGPSGAES
jgi:hypothetical protein